MEQLTCGFKGCTQQATIFIEDEQDNNKMFAFCDKCYEEFKKLWKPKLSN